MPARFILGALGAVAVCMHVAGCAGPLDAPARRASLSRTLPADVQSVPSSQFRTDQSETGSKDTADNAPALDESSGLDEYVQWALYHSPKVEASYQRWRAMSERLPQVRALPDPMISAGYFPEETMMGEQARFGVQQTFPWPGKLSDMEDAASRAAFAAWREYEAARLEVIERVVDALAELSYLDAATRITNENLDLLQSFEEVVRARYRVSEGSHPELVRVQVELGQLEDRLKQLQSMRPAMVADLNAVLNRVATAPVAALPKLPGRVAAMDIDELVTVARSENPELRALDEKVEEQRTLTEVARKDGLPDMTVGLDYMMNDRVAGMASPANGEDRVMLSLGLTIPIWRSKYAAEVQESIAKRLAVSHQRADESNQIAAELHQAWFAHLDADRRVRLYERTLIPKAEESLRASLAGFQGGRTNFLDLLDTERTLLEFAVSAERARADREEALAKLNRLVGRPVPTRPADEGETVGTDRDQSREVQP